MTLFSDVVAFMLFKILTFNSQSLGTVVLSGIAGLPILLLQFHHLLESEVQSDS